jgi:hypothetical protein
MILCCMEWNICRTNMILSVSFLKFRGEHFVVPPYTRKCLNNLSVDAIL